MNNIAKTKLIIRIIKNSGIKGFANLFKYQYDLRFKKNKVLANPIFLQLEPTSRCNLKCKMCEHSFKRFHKQDLSFEQFKHIINQLPFLKSLTLQGLGEPLLNLELFKMIKEAKQRDIRVGLTTNATLLNKENARRIVDSGLDWLYISLDSVDKKIYEEIRRGANYEIVLNNIKNFIEFKGDRLPETDFWTLIMKENLAGISKVIELADKLKIKKIILQNIHNWGHEDFSKDVNKFKCDSEKELLKLVDEISTAVNTVKVELNSNIKENNKKKCDWPWRSLYITCDGYVTPCCMQGADSDIINFGNVFKKPINEILNNEKYQEFRNKLKNKPIPRICIGCPAYYKQKVIKI